MRPLSPRCLITGPRGTRHLATRRFRYRYLLTYLLKTQHGWTLRKTAHSGEHKFTPHPVPRGAARCLALRFSVNTAWRCACVALVLRVTSAALPARIPTTALPTSTISPGRCCARSDSWRRTTGKTSISWYEISSVYSCCYKSTTRPILYDCQDIDLQSCVLVCTL